MTHTRALILGALVLIPVFGTWAYLRPTQTGDLCQATGALTQPADYAAMAAEAFAQTAFAGDGATLVHVVAGDLIVADVDPAITFPGHFAEISNGDILHVSPFTNAAEAGMVHLRSPDVSAHLSFTPCGAMAFENWFASRDDVPFDWPQVPLAD